MTVASGADAAATLKPRGHSAVGLLEARARATAAELLRLAAPWVSDNELPVVSHEDVLDLLLGGLVNEFLVVRHDALGDSLAHGVDLACETATLDTDADVHLLEFIAEQQHRLVHLHSENVWLHRMNRAAIHPH